MGGDAFVGLEGGGAWDFERNGANGPVRAIASGTGPNRRVLTKTAPPDVILRKPERSDRPGASS